MSSKSVLIILAATLAVAMTGMMMFSTDSDASIGTEEPFAPVIEAEVPMEKDPMDSLRSAPEQGIGMCVIHNETQPEQPTPAAEPERSEEKDHPDNGMMMGCAPAPAGPSSSAPAPSSASAGPVQPGPSQNNSPNNSFSPNGPFSNQPRAVRPVERQINIPTNESRSTEEVIEEYEEAYRQKRAAKDVPIELIDDTNYTGEQADIVDVMKRIIESEDVSEDDFLVQVIHALESEGKASAASTVQRILDQRFIDVSAVLSVQQSGNQRSKDGSEEEEDDMDDPVRIEDREEEEDAPVTYDASFDDGIECDSGSADMSFCVRYDNRGCCVAI